MRGARAREGCGLTDHPGTDQRRLREEAYPDSTNLNARASIYAFRTPQLDFWDWALDHATWEAGQRVLDIGCGPGTYLQRLDVRTPGLVRVGADLSEGMTREAATGGVAGLIASVQAVPVTTGSIDRVLAMHMLYHAPDIPSAVGELRRVLRSGGVLLAVTNGARHLVGTTDVICRAAGVERVLRFIDRFTLETASESLERHFDRVELDEVEGELAVPHVEPVMAYLRSMRALIESQLPVTETWEWVMSRAEALVADEIERTGAWRCPTHSGVFVCR